MHKKKIKMLKQFSNRCLKTMYTIWWTWIALKSVTIDNITNIIFHSKPFRFIKSLTLEQRQVFLSYETLHSEEFWNFNQFLFFCKNLAENAITQNISAECNVQQFCTNNQTKRKCKLRKLNCNEYNLILKSKFSIVINTIHIVFFKIRYNSLQFRFLSETKTFVQYDTK